jgi:hypothetical protein
MEAKMNNLPTSLRFYTSTIRVAGGNPSGIDITVKGNHPIGRIFAPTWKMVNDYKSGIKIDKPVAIKQYKAAYCRLMVESYRKNYQTWIKTLTMRNEVIFYCFCPANDFCHRLLLADYLIQLGADYIGELY